LNHDRHEKGCAPRASSNVTCPNNQSVIPRCESWEGELVGLTRDRREFAKISWRSLVHDQLVTIRIHSVMIESKPCASWRRRRNRDSRLGLCLS
jgi:hypothetical protein